jgi:3-methyladenine DNA glycosylase AlkD
MSSKLLRARDAIAALERHATQHDAVFLQGYFKTGPGEYGEGDVFIGVRVPQVRSVAKAFRGMALAEALELLKSPIHEIRLLGLLIMVQRYEKGTDADRAAVYEAYLSSTDRINNWDLVDLSSHEIVGAHLLTRSRRPLYRLAGSRNVWERRIAIVSTHAFIRNRDFDDTLAIAERLMMDRHDLIHKACGWMLREVGKRDEARLKAFLDRHCKSLPRTMLRYAIERLTGAEKARYMKRD